MNKPAATLLCLFLVGLGRFAWAQPEADEPGVAVPPSTQPATGPPAAVPAPPAKPVPPTSRPAAPARTKPAAASASPAIKLSSPRLVAAPATEPPRLLSRATAMWLSIGCTLGGIGLGIGLTPVAGIAGLAISTLGIGFGPSAGHAYAGEWGHFGIFSAIRIVLAGGGGAMFAVGLIGVALASEDDDDVTALGAMAICGGLLSAASLALAVYDIYDGTQAVVRTNYKRRTRVGLAPLVARADGATHYGLSALVRF